MKRFTLSAALLAVATGGTAFADVTFYNNSDLTFVLSPFESRAAFGPGLSMPLLEQTTLYPLSSPANFAAWINAFNNNEPGCDQNADGACTPTDFTAWINNFTNGC